MNDLIDRAALREKLWEEACVIEAPLIHIKKVEAIIDAAPVIDCEACSDYPPTILKTHCQVCFCADNFQRRQP